MANDELEASRQARIKGLKREIAAVAGEGVISMGISETPSGIEEQFLEYVLAFEQAEQTQLFDTLVNGGLDLPAPDDLDDAALSKKLWQAIQALSLLRTFLENTDHLSDRELYETLWHDALREESFMQPPTSQDYACHFDILGGCSAADMVIYLKYYASEQERKDWVRDYPQDDLPSQEVLPYDRDCLLPTREASTQGQC